MITFSGGPLDEKSLRLDRAPYFVRGILCDDGSVDALSELSDTIRMHETPSAYVMIEGPFRAFVRSSKPGAGGLYIKATYKFVQPQPALEEMMDNSRWAAWCESHRPKQ